MVNLSEKSKCFTLSTLPYIERGTPKFIRATQALFSSGLATFALLYCVQPILPVLSYDFGISPAQSSLALSVSTGLLAIGLIFTGPLSDAIGRKSVMLAALLLAAICTLICTVITSWSGILIMRAVIGLSLSGVVAAGMTYLSEEIHPNFITFSMGLYISGNAIGGMSGRLVTGLLADFASWRIGLTVIGVFALLAVGLLWRILPSSKHFCATSPRIRTLIFNFKLHWRDRGMLLLFLEGFLLMGSLVTIYNYIGYRLLIAPYHFNQAMISFLLSAVYVTGTYSSSKAGLLAMRFGLGSVLYFSISMMLAGILITDFTSIGIIFFGLMLFTSGFFAAHAVASSWLSMRAHHAKGQASSLYLFFYYLGSSLAGTIGGMLWNRYSWHAVVVFITAMLLIALLAAYHLKRIPEAEHV